MLLRHYQLESGQNQLEIIIIYSIIFASLFCLMKYLEKVRNKRHEINPADSITQVRKSRNKEIHQSDDEDKWITKEQDRKNRRKTRKYLMSEGNCSKGCENFNCCCENCDDGV